MKYELRKVLGDRRLCLLLALVVLANAWLYHRHCTDSTQGFTMAQVQAKYSEDLETLQAQAEALRERIFLDTADEDETLMTGSVFHELLLDNAVIARMEQTAGYAEYRQGLVQESQLKLKLGLLGSAGSFSTRSLERGAAAYAALEPVTPVMAFFGGIELLVGWHASDLLLLAFCLTPALVLLTLEKGTGLDKLARPAKLGRRRLYLRKCGAALVLTTAGFVLLYGADALITAALFDCGSLSSPVQSVYGFNGCPWKMTVGEFLVYGLLLKYLWALACTALCVFLCSAVGAAAAVVALSAVCAAAALLLRSTSVLWLRCVSLCQLPCGEELFQGAVYLNFFGRPIQRLPAAALFAALVGIAAFWGAQALFCRTPSGAALRVRPWRLPARLHTRLLCFEGRKLFLLCRGAAVLLALLVVQAVTYRSFEVNNSVYEHAYRNYSSILTGAPSAEKDAYLETEAARFQEIHAKLEAYEKIYGPSSSYPADAEELLTALLAESPFEEARRQYEGLTEGQIYLHQTGYERLLNIQGQRDDLINLAKFLLALVLVLPGVFAVDAESGVRVLQVTAGKEKAVLGRKAVLSCAFVLLAALLAFLPQYLAVFDAYGGLILSAQANSVNLLYAVPSQWTVGGYFAAVNLGRVLLGCAAGILISVLSAKTRSTVIGMILSFVLIFVPVGLAFLWVL